MDAPFLAFDLGAESGRAVVGLFENGRLRLVELGRFPNEMVTVSGHLHWESDS
ncbi:MAG: hypothetical protein MUO75_03990 [Actinobacteria bacterium]|nr:hypothetical protein [Actinomycetota bacterium]